MLSFSKPISSIRAAPASVTDSGVSRALGIRQRLVEERLGQREDSIRCLGVRVVTGTLDDGELTEAPGQISDDLLALGAGVGPVGVETALDDQDRAGDVGQLRAGVGRAGLAH